MSNLRHVLLPLLLVTVPAAAWAQGATSDAGKVIDRSGTTTGSSQVVMAANSGRVYCEIQSLTVDLRVAIDNPATTGPGSYWLPAGSLFKCPAQAPTGVISIIGTASAPFTATEYQR